LYHSSTGEDRQLRDLVMVARGFARSDNAAFIA
jgi:hypothetical protein